MPRPNTRAHVFRVKRMNELRALPPNLLKLCTSMSLKNRFNKMMQAKGRARQSKMEEMKRHLARSPSLVGIVVDHDNDHTLFHLAAKYDLVELLDVMDLKKAITLRNHRGVVPLNTAAGFNSPQVLDRLLPVCNSIAALVDALNVATSYHQHSQIAKIKARIMDLLPTCTNVEDLSAAVFIDAVYHRMRPSEIRDQLMTQLGQDLVNLCWDGETLLHYAVRKERTEMIPVLVHMGFDVNLVCGDHTPLTRAVGNRIKRYRLDLIHTLLKAGASTDALSNDLKTALSQIDFDT